MPEGTPKLPKIDDKENAERTPRYRAIEREVLEIHEDGSQTERVLECNGLHHRRCIDKIFYDESGEVVSADQVSREELGACDGNHA